MIVSKLEAARRQLETAINLYFHEGDQVSIHTLACAAHEIVEQLNKGKGGEPTLNESWKELIKPGFEREFHDMLHAAQNFFKHSGTKDHDTSIKLVPLHSNALLLDACWTYRRITNERLPVLATFELWAAITWAKTTVTYPGLDLTEPDVVKWTSMSRQEFFGVVLPVAYLAIVATTSSTSASSQNQVPEGTEQ